MYILVQPTYPRTKLEKLFKFSYNSCTTLVFTAFVIGITIFITRVSTTFADYWRNNDLVVHHDLHKILVNCSYSGKYSFGAKEVNYFVNESNNAQLFLSNAVVIMWVYMLVGVTIVLMMFNKVCFALNIRFYRFKGIVLKTNSIVMTLEFGVTVVVYILIGYSIPQVAFVKSYIEHCTEIFLKQQPGVEMTISTVFDNASYTPLLVTLAINQAVYFVGLLLLLSDGVRHHNALYFSKKYDYTKGFFGLPDKPKVRARVQEFRRIFAALTEEERAGPMDVAPVIVAEGGREVAVPQDPKTMQIMMAPPPIPPPDTYYPPSQGRPQGPTSSSATVGSVPVIERRHHHRHRSHSKDRRDNSAKVAGGVRRTNDGGDAYNPRSRSHSK